MTVVATVCFAALAVSAALCLLRVVRSEGLPDRAIALDTVTATIISGIAVGIVATGDGTYADVALVLSLLGFLATVTIARYMGRRGP
ncbi:monovalent cation/H+ antiporter complex subunit F [Iamia sp.]|jgi:multicomponent Na+:H+ antiporter subunit F|uniref:monovalent cation/H+ antiporter complex subunit F n=1 Tax=Iamia sp. TaxID=2722710 RepID=UPI002D15AC1A|nr:monovalent cation/H+ antiporter complex subunit F [Iamia sp.]HXH57508.1 monovalent cation/H+ antiporter complex subunit F [Iamia sp.]